GCAGHDRTATLRPLPLRSWFDCLRLEPRRLRRGSPRILPSTGRSPLVSRRRPRATGNRTRKSLLGNREVHPPRAASESECTRMSLLATCRNVCAARSRTDRNAADLSVAIPPSNLQFVRVVAIQEAGAGFAKPRPGQVEARDASYPPAALR